MMHLVFTIAGTVAATAALLLFAVKFMRNGPRAIYAAARRWAAMRIGPSGLIIFSLAASAALSFASLDEAPQENAGVPGLAAHGRASEPGIGSGPFSSVGDDAAARALESLRAYADKIAEKRQTIAALSEPGEAAEELPAVDTMIARLAARLENEPGDVAGWKMLAWSYLNTGKQEEAARAYETALKLSPDDAAIKQGLDAARGEIPQGRPQVPHAGSSAAGAGPSEAAISAAESLSGEQRNDMIRGMVDRLAARLQSAPQDEEGWIRLMRARMVLGEKEAARAALAKALEAFGGETAAKERLNASARDLGVN